MVQHRYNTKWKNNKKRKKHSYKKNNQLEGKNNPPERADKHLDALYQQLIQLFQSEMNLVVEYIRHCSEEQLLWSPTSEQWNIKQQSGYLSLYIAHQGKVLKAFLNKFELPEKFEMNKGDLSELFNNSSIENILTQLKTNMEFLLAQLYLSTDIQWQIQFSIVSEETNISKFITDVSTYISELREDIFMNLQRHKVWYNPLEKVTE